MGNFSAHVPVAYVGKANAILADLGFGPTNFSVPVNSAGSTMSDFVALHCWQDGPFLAAVKALDAGLGVVVTEAGTGNPALGQADPTGIPGKPNLPEACAKSALTYVPYDGTNASLPKTGDVVTYQGKQWTCLADFNPFAPPINYREKPPAGTLPAWTQPTNAKDSYPIGFEVAHKGKNWRSVIAANTTEPGLDPRWWTDLTPVVDEWPLFVQPTHAGNVYAKDAKVTFEGKHYQSAIANNSWSPTVYPAGWILRA